MNINKENYEAFYLDFLEGNLTPAMEKKFVDFLNSNPDLKIDDEGFLNEIEKESITIEKDFLRRETTTGLKESDYLMIAAVENELNSEEKKQLAALLQTEEHLAEELALFHKSKLKVDTSVSFSDKASLYKKSTIIPLWVKYSSAVAAAIVLFLFIPSIWSGKLSTKQYQPYATSFSLDFDNYDSLNTSNLIIEKSLDKAKPIIKPVMPQNQLANTSTIKKQPNPKNVKNIEKQDEIVPEIEEDFAREEAVKNETIDDAEPSLPKESNTLAEKAENEFTPINEFIKAKVLRNKSFSENLADELANATNDKVIFTKETGKNSETQKFAINIGKFSLSRKKTKRL